MGGTVKKAVSKRLLDGLDVWVGWRLPAVALWASVVLLPVIVIAPDHVSRDWLWLLAYPTVAQVRQCVFGIKSVVAFFAWLVFFPLLGSLTIGFDLLSFAGRTSWLLATLSRPLLSFVYLFLQVLVSLLAWTFNYTSAFPWLAAAAVLFNGLLLVSSVRWSVSPLRWLVCVARYVLIRDIRNEFRKRRKVATHGAKAVQDDRDNLVSEYRFRASLLRMVASDLQRWAAYGFLAYFGLLFASTVVTFSVVYYGLTVRDMIHGLPSAESECLMYSLSVLTTSPISGVDLISRPARLAYCLELASTVLLITVFVAGFGIGLSIDAKVPTRIKRVQTDFARLYKKLLDEYDADLRSTMQDKKILNKQ